MTEKSVRPHRHSKVRLLRRGHELTSQHPTHHLGSHQNIGFFVFKIMNDFFKCIFRLCGIQIHSRNSCIPKK